MFFNRKDTWVRSNVSSSNCIRLGALRVGLRKEGVLWCGPLISMEIRSKIIVLKAIIICPADNFYCAGIVNFTMLALLSGALGKFRNIRPRVTDDIWAQTADCDREVKSQYRQEMSHGRKLWTHEKLHFEFLRTRRETNSRDRKVWLSGSAAPLSYTARLCTFRIHHIRFYTLSIAHAPFTTHFDCHSSRYYTPRLPTFRLRTFGHPHLRCYNLLFLHKAIVDNAFTRHLDATQPIHYIPFLHSSIVHVNSVNTTRTSISHG